MILFPADSLERHEVERDYRAEWDAAQNAGFETAIFDFDSLRRGEPIERILRRVPLGAEARTLVYRGWMLRADDYAQLFDGLGARGWNLSNDAPSYRFAHHAPENYGFWRDFLPETKWIERARFEQNGAIEWAPIFETVRAFGGAPVIVKDWVKSQKQEWSEACFLPNSSDETGVRRVVGRFLELTGDNLTGGLVFRRFERLRPGEWRSFWLGGKLLSLSPNPNGDQTPDMEPLRPLARRCPSRFFTLDLAQREDGSWLLIEMGDGGVSGLPATLDAGEFYGALKSRIAGA